jgi:hypothetical protein
MRDVFLNARRGAYIAMSVVGLVAALLLGVSFPVAALIGIACGSLLSRSRTSAGSQDGLPSTRRTRHPVATTLSRPESMLA